MSMFQRLTRRLCSIYSISPGDIWLLTNPDDAQQYELLSNENTILGEVAKASWIRSR